MSPFGPQYLAEQFFPQSRGMFPLENGAKVETCGPSPSQSYLTAICIAPMNKW